jgi:hypothetical protein
MKRELQVEVGILLRVGKDDDVLLTEPVLRRLQEILLSGGDKGQCVGRYSVPQWLDAICSYLVLNVLH